MNGKDEKKQEKEVKVEKKPNEIGGFYFSSVLKIYDPESKEILVQKRGDT